MTCAERSARDSCTGSLRSRLRGPSFSISVRSSAPWIRRRSSLNLWTLGWDLKTLSAHPGWLLSGRIFDANIFFPAHRHAGLLRSSAAAGVPSGRSTPSRTISSSVTTLLLVASLVASALAMHVLARTVVGSEWAAYVAGLIFGFAPYHFTHLDPHSAAGSLFLPLSFFFLHRLLRRPARRTPSRSAFMGLQAVSSVYYGIIGGVGVACAAIVLAILSGRCATGGYAARARGNGDRVLVALPWSIPYVRVEREAAPAGTCRRPPTAARFS